MLGFSSVLYTETEQQENKFEYPFYFIHLFIIPIAVINIFCIYLYQDYFKPEQSGCKHAGKSTFIFKNILPKSEGRG